MSYSSALKVCDYVTLHSGDIATTVTNGVYTWNIPQSYYTNQRSQVCTVECTKGVATIPDATDRKATIFAYENNGYNHFSSRGRPVIAYGHVNSLNVQELYGCGELLTSARPQQITIKASKLNQGAVPTTTVSSLTLKFTYYNALETARELQSEKTVHL